MRLASKYAEILRSEMHEKLTVLGDHVSNPIRRGVSKLTDVLVISKKTMQLNQQTMIVRGRTHTCNRGDSTHKR